MCCHHNPTFVGTSGEIINNMMKGCYSSQSPVITYYKTIQHLFIKECLGDIMYYRYRILCIIE